MDKKCIKRYIFTGTPGSGKTSVLEGLHNRRYDIITEAATDVIAIEQGNRIPTPWDHSSFIDKITLMQHNRQVNASGDLQFYDRSPFCTYALAIYLGYPISYALSAEIDRCLKENVYDNRVFFFENLGFIENTDARKISYEEALKFEKIHTDVYKKFGFEIISVPIASVEERADLILESLV